MSDLPRLSNTGGSSSDAGPSAPSQPLQPLLNPRYRHISRSAAKRESVQLLGSIKDLQAHFSRTSLEHKAGVGAGLKGHGLSAVGEEGDENVPRYGPPRGESLRGAVLGSTRERKPWKEVQLQRIDPETAKREARQVMDDMKSLWGLTPHLGSAQAEFPAASSQHRLIKTAQSIRRIRELSLSVSSPPTRRVSAGTLTLPRPVKGRASISTPSRPATLPRAVSNGAPPERKSSLGAMQEAKHDDLAELRKASLEVLAGLRALEERLRMHATSGDDSLPPRNEVSEAHLAVNGNRVVSNPSSDEAESRPGSSLSATVSSEPESFNEEDEAEYNLNILAADGDLHKHLETWEERIVSEQRQYRAMEPADGARERAAVGRWVTVVEAVFMGGYEPARRAAWVNDGWDGKEIDRIHDFLLSHLPLDMQLYLPNKTDPNLRYSLLNRLSDGFILLATLNTAIHSSSRVWGAVPAEDIHNTLSSVDASGMSGSVTPDGQDDRASDGWTFRRTENLVAWAAALRHRYAIPVDLPAAKPASAFLNPPHPTVRTKSSAGQDGRPIIQPLPPGPAQVAATWRKEREQGEVVLFDPAKVARKEDGWEGMLEGLVRKWVEKVAAEVREAEMGQGSGRVEEEEGE